MNDLTVEELLLIISDKEKDLEQSNKAFSTLYYRYSIFLNSAVINQLKSKGIYDKTFVDTIASNVFVEVFSNPLNFSYNEKDHQTEDIAFKAWICRIARFEFADILRESIKFNKMNLLSRDGILQDQTENFTDDMDIISNNRKLLDKSLECLSDREKHVLLACYDYYEDGKNTPSEVLDMLCQYWGTTRDNVRQIRKRALDKVKAYLNNSIKLKGITS
jgi:DNA-directed RNA polymerase specialized sigma24 family protein